MTSIDLPAAARRASGALALALLAQAIGAVPALAMDKPAAVAQLKATGIAASAASLVQYAALGDAATVALLVDAGVAVTEQDPVRKVSALHNAAAQGHLRLSARLLDLGAHVDAVDWYGVTPLVAAAAGGHVKIVELLLAKGANVNVVPQKAPTALLCAIERDEAGLVELLLKAGARPALADAFGRTPLAAASMAGRTGISARIEAALAAGAK
jgi:ankyrin repeat protein